MRRVVFILLLLFPVMACAVASPIVTHKEILNQLEVYRNELEQMQREQRQTVGRARWEKYKSAVNQHRKQLFTVVVDAGHGGKDSGAIGKSGLKEKNVALEIAKKLAEKCARIPGVKVVMTRKGDYFVPLRKRIHFARRDDADLFIAVHADAYFNHKASGASVYALSQRGATSEAALWLAKQDNYSELDDIDLNKLPDNSPVLRSVLIDMSQTATIRASLQLGNKVLDALDDLTDLHHKQVEQAPFVVLKSPDIPSILVETGFISHPVEEQKLANPAYQEKIAEAVYKGVEAYIRKYAGK